MLLLLIDDSNRMKRVLLILCTVLLLSASCHRPSVAPEDGKTRIVVTTTLLADVIKNIVRDSAQVVSIMGPGVDPHLYKASLGDLDHFVHADLIFYQGLHLEGKMAEVLEKLSRTKPVYALASRLPKDKVFQPAEGGDFPDPHIWFDVKLWEEVVIYAEEILSETYPQWSDYLRSNTREYLEKLDALHRSVLMQIQSIPEGKRVLITAHDAFGYFGRAYGIQVRGLQGISTQSEFGLKDVSNLVKLIVERDIQAVFVETSVSDKALRAVIEGVAGKGKQVRIGGLLYTDALGEPGSGQGDYIGMITYNVATIVNALK